MASDDLDSIDWSLTTWEGSEREQLRRWAALSLEEILLAQEQMRETTEKLHGAGSAATRTRGEPEAPESGGEVWTAPDPRTGGSDPPALPFSSDEFVASLDPADLIELMIGEEDRVPRALIDECARRGDEMLVALSDAMEDELGEDATAEPSWLPLHAAMILGLMPSERAGLLLVRLMRALSTEGEDDLQDWLSGKWPALFANKPDTVQAPLRDIVADRALDWYLRANALDAVVAHAFARGPEALDEALDRLALMAAEPTEDPDMRLSCGELLLDFPRERHRAVLQRLADVEAGDTGPFRSGGVEDAFSRGEDDPNWRRFDDPWEFYSPDAIADRQEDRPWEEDEEAEGLEDWETDPAWDSPGGEFPEPYVRTAPKIGRNDPCPCGSGKKYKKCCLGKLT